MKKNSSNSTPNVSLSNEVRNLIFSYIDAYNAGQKAEAEKILHKIKQQQITDHE